MRFLRGAFLSLLVASACGVAQAWDAAGHMLVNEIAWEQMSPAARERAAELSKPLETRFNDVSIMMYSAATLLYFVSAFAINRIAKVVETRVRIPGTFGGGK